MTPINNKPLATVKSISGLWSRDTSVGGSVDDTPPDHLTVCNNCIFPDSGISQREGLAVLATLANRAGTFFPYSAAVRAQGNTSTSYPLIYMDPTTGSLYNGGVPGNPLIKTFTGATGFTCTEAFGRLYLAPTQFGVALPADFTYYWDGLNIFPLAGVGPATAVTLAQVNAGVVTAGVHGVAVSFLYADGFLSRPFHLNPGDVTTNITSTGANDIEVSNIPTGGANVVGRVLLMTLANQITLFFVPGGTINNNISTTAIINVADTALLSSADYLNDIAISVPSCTCIRFYNGRMIYIGCSDFSYIIQVSDVGIYDSINLVNNLISIPRDGGVNSPSSGLVQNNITYILKPYGTYSLQDNQQVPNLWPVSIIDAALGSFNTGVSTFASGLSGQDSMDASFVAHPKGLLLFTGVYGLTPLSYKIDSLWTSLLNPSSVISNFSQLTLANDIIGKRLYIVIPPVVASGTINNIPFVLMMDYNLGLTPKDVRWSVWTPNSPRSSSPSYVMFSIDQGGNPNVLFTMGTLPVSGPINGNDSVLYDLNAAFTADFATVSIMQQITFSPFFSSEGTITTFVGLKWRMNGAGKVITTLSNVGGNLPSSAAPINLSAYTTSNQDFFRGINYTSEKMLVTMTGDASTLGWFSLKRLDVYGNPRYNMRPAITQSS